MIVTCNLADFPPDALATFDIEAQHPDEFILHLLDLAPGLVIEAAQKPSNQFEESAQVCRGKYLDSLETQGLTQTVSALREYMV
ncbi:MAG TPA: hypothetical protein VK638_57885 [Edaphobacter sp.]|nr:hypothetical protein [Edaphobacter sp.]